MQFARILSRPSTRLFSTFAIVWVISMSPAALAQSGAAGGASAENANPDLEFCEEPMGTLAVYEDQRERWWHDYYRRYPSLGSTVPVLRMMVQQSNCFVVVERGKAMNTMMGERTLQNSGELREGSNFGQGQMVAADFTMSPSIQFSEKTGGVGGLVSGLIGSKNSALGALVGGLKKKEASTTLLLVDNRSSVQVAAAAGNAAKFDFSAGLGVLGRSAGGALGGFTRTPEGKVIVSAFADSYNNMVRALRNYSAQEVEGGLGKGGKLKIGN